MTALAVTAARGPPFFHLVGCDLLAAIFFLSFSFPFPFPFPFRALATLRLRSEPCSQLLLLLLLAARKRPAAVILGGGPRRCSAPNPASRAPGRTLRPACIRPQGIAPDKRPFRCATRVRSRRSRASGRSGRSPAARSRNRGLLPPFRLFFSLCHRRRPATGHRSIPPRPRRRPPTKPRSARLLTSLPLCRRLRRRPARVAPASPIMRLRMLRRRAVLLCAPAALASARPA